MSGGRREVFSLSACVLTSARFVGPCIEHVARHIFQNEKAVAPNPVAPDYGGLGVHADDTVSAKGAAVTCGFQAWLAETQKEKGKSLQQERLYRDELDRPAENKDRDGEERATRASRRRSPKLEALSPRFFGALSQA